MPPKPRFTREEIGSSARLIFTVFRSMEELQQEVRSAAMRRFESYAGRTMPGVPLFRQGGMQMVLFGAQEPKLYQLLFMRENRSAVSFDDVFGELGDTAECCIETVCRDYGLSPAQARVLFEHVWIYTFGVGALCATRVCRFSEEQLGGCSPRSFRR